MDLTAWRYRTSDGEQAVVDWDEERNLIPFRAWSWLRTQNRLARLKAKRSRPKWIAPFHRGFRK